MKLGEDLNTALHSRLTGITNLEEGKGIFIFVDLTAFRLNSLF